MKPYYQDDWATIYHGDCLSVIAEAEIPELNGIVMDPPYASGTRKESGRSSSGAMVRGERWAEKPIKNDQMTTPGFIWLMRETLFSLIPLLEEGASVLSFIDWRQWGALLGAVESTNLRVQGMVVWNKLGYGMGNGFRNQHELVMHASKGVPTIHDRGVGNVLDFARDNKSPHPSPKPIGLIAKMLGVVTGDGATIIDPFMGNGPALCAAKQTGRKAIGIETEEAFCEIAANRLAQEVLDFGPA